MSLFSPREHKQCEQLAQQTLSDREVALFHAGSVLRAVTGGHGGFSIDAEIDRLAWQELAGNGFWTDEQREFMRRQLTDQINLAYRMVLSSKRHAGLRDNKFLDQLAAKLTEEMKGGGISVNAARQALFDASQSAETP